MACARCGSLLHAYRSVQGAVWQVTAVRWFQTSAPVTVGGKWRLERGEAINNSAYGPLTDLPDYSYLDGRPTPLSKGQKLRRMRRIGIAKRIKLLTDEMIMARENYEKHQTQLEDAKQDVLRKKLRPKIQS